MTKVTLFISYSHQNKLVVDELAARLRNTDQFDVWIDDEILAGEDLYEKIFNAIENYDFFLAVVSEPANSSMWCKEEVNTALHKRLKNGQKPTVIPLKLDEASIPIFLERFKYINLNSQDVSSCVDDLVNDFDRGLAKLAAQAKANPEVHEGPITQPVAFVGRERIESPIEIEGLDFQGMTKPRNDGSRGSALYIVPLTLNRIPSEFWQQNFKQMWDRPPSSTGMHRPGIAYVSGNSIVLDGTTMDEVENYHLTTLRGVIDELNTAEQKYEKDLKEQELHDSEFNQQRRLQADSLRRKIKGEK